MNWAGLVHAGQLQQSRKDLKAGKSKTKTQFVLGTKSWKGQAWTEHGTRKQDPWDKIDSKKEQRGTYPDCDERERSVGDGRPWRLSAASQRGRVENVDDEHCNGYGEGRAEREGLYRRASWTLLRLSIEVISLVAAWRTNPL